MIEALEIGISLALGDGVSEGVAVARRDLQAIETAMTAGAVSVQRLRDAAAGALGVVQATTGRKGVRGAIPAEDSREGADMEKPAPVRPPLQAAQTAPAGVLKPAAAGFSAASGGYGREPVAARTAIAASAPDRLATGTVSEAGDSVPAPDVPALAGAAGPSHLPPAQAAPSVTILRMESGAPASASPLSPSTPGGVERSSPYPAARATAEVPWAGTQAPEAARPGRDGAGISNIAAEGWRAPDAAKRFAAPVVMQQQASQPRDDGGRPSVAPALASAPAGQAREPSRMEGDVFLDGLLVGRWMSNYLAREAGRASAGPTGFDARHTPLMPGATVAM